MRRNHAGTSRQANVSHEDRAQWFDSAAPAGFPMPRTRLLGGYLKAVARFQRELDDICSRNRCERIIVDTSRNMAELFVDYLNQRSQRTHGRAGIAG